MDKSLWETWCDKVLVRSGVEIDRGVTQKFITNYRRKVVDLLGLFAFQYLDSMLDAKDGEGWKVAPAFSWSKLYSLRAKDSVIIAIDVGSLAKRMIKRGFTSNVVSTKRFDGWTNTLMDILEEDYQLETELIKAICDGGK